MRPQEPPPPLTQTEQQMLVWFERWETVAAETTGDLSGAAATARQVAEVMGWYQRQGEYGDIRALATLGYLALFDHLVYLDDDDRWALPGYPERLQRQDAADKELMIVTLGRIGTKTTIPAIARAAWPSAPKSRHDQLEARARRILERLTAAGQVVRHGKAWWSLAALSAQADGQPLSVDGGRKRGVFYQGPIITWETGGTKRSHIAASAVGEQTCCGEPPALGTTITRKPGTLAQQECCVRCWQRWRSSQLGPLRWAAKEGHH